MNIDISEFKIKKKSITIKGISEIKKIFDGTKKNTIAILYLLNRNNTMNHIFK